MTTYTQEQREELIAALREEFTQDHHHETISLLVGVANMLAAPSTSNELIDMAARLAESELRANQLEVQFKAQCKITAAALEERAKMAAPSASPAFLDQFKVDPTDKWPGWMKDATVEKSASFPKSTPKALPPNDFDTRGILSKSLKCWHRLTGIEAQELVDFMQAMDAPSTSNELIDMAARLADSELRANQLEAQFNSQCQITAAALEELWLDAPSASPAVVRVCPDKDSVCGDNSRYWCNSCPKHTVAAPSTSPDALKVENEQLRAALAEYARAGVGNSTDWRIQLSALRMATAIKGGA